ncbi:hypothetical protein [Bradyrhizobium sp. S3.7.6]
MKTIKTKTIHTMKVQVGVTSIDINDGECRVATLCMEKVAIARALKTMFPNEPAHKLHVRVDAGHIKFNIAGYHWRADTPAAAKKALIDFDRNVEVRPHKYTFTATRLGKVQPMSRDRQIQINVARDRRKAEGKPDKIYNAAIRKRIVGYDLTHGEITKAKRASTDSSHGA